MKNIFNTLIVMFIGIAVSQAQNVDVLIRINTSIEMEPNTTGYANSAGHTVIPIGKYVYCFTEKFDKIAIVLHKRAGDAQNQYYAIDRNENILFKVAAFDNAPDNVKEGLFRIIVDDKMGFANMNGEIVIKPTFKSVRQFSEGYAAFCIGGEETKEGEYTKIVGGKWGFLDKSGNIKIPAQFDQVYGSFKNGKVIVELNGIRFGIDKNGNRID